MNITRFRPLLGAAALLSLALALPAAAQGISQKVAVCDPSFTSRCIKPDANGAVPVTTGSGTTASQVQGNSASGVADVGNPVKIGGVYNAAPPTLTSGQRGDLQIGARGQLSVTIMSTSGASAVGGVNGTNADGSSNTISSINTTGFNTLFNGTTWDRVRDAVTTNATTGTGITAAGAMGKFNSVLPTYTDGQFGNVQATNRGILYSQLTAAGATIPTTGAAVDSYSNSSIVALADTYRPLAVANSLFNGTTWDRLRSVAGADGTGLGVTAYAATPHSAATASLTPAVSAAVTGGVIYKASAGNLYSVSVTAGASAGFLLMFNSTTIPADGAVTPQQCIPVAANAMATWEAVSGGVPERFTTGIVGVFSTTGCYTKTISPTAFLRAKFQ